MRMHKIERYANHRGEMYVSSGLIWKGRPNIKGRRIDINTIESEEESTSTILPTEIIKLFSPKRFAQEPTRSAVPLREIILNTREELSMAGWLPSKSIKLRWAYGSSGVIAGLCPILITDKDMNANYHKIAVRTVLERPICPPSKDR